MTEVTVNLDVHQMVIISLLLLIIAVGVWIQAMKSGN
jgi:hypothetical protein